MIRYFLTIVFLVGFSASALCQQGKASPGEHRLFPDRNTYSLGINTQFAIDGLLDQSTFTPVEILWRKGMKSNQAFRTRIKGMLANTDRNDEQERRKTHQSQLALALGYEWHRPLGNRFGYYYGMELEMGVQYQDSVRNYIDFEIGEFHTKRKESTKTNHFIILPFVGFTYQLSPKLYISSEFKLEINYHTIEKYSEFSYALFENPDDYVIGSYGKFDVHIFKLNMRPYTGVYINIKF
ncbi:hypothetical protein [Negadavirga shengliensis]|uniref:Outer membrane protein beta-barrel domain-containing protein n=1 Tax=Negadavirga shengliensis TaxID=1389218 RepID=A0ABV9T095_9BACT